MRKDLCWTFTLNGYRKHSYYCKEYIQFISYVYHERQQTQTLKLSNQIHLHVRCWHEVASHRFHWLCCSWQRGSFPQPSPSMPSWPSRLRCASGCWASLEPQRTPPVKQNQTAGRRWARCRWPWHRTLWAAPKPRRCTQRIEKEPRGCLDKEGGQVTLSRSVSVKTDQEYKSKLWLFQELWLIYILHFLQFHCAFYNLVF